MADMFSQREPMPKSNCRPNDYYARAIIGQLASVVTELILWFRLSGTIRFLLLFED